MYSVIYVPGTRLATALFVLLALSRFYVTTTGSSTLEQEILSIIWYMTFAGLFYFAKTIVAKLFIVGEHRVDLGTF